MVQVDNEFVAEATLEPPGEGDGVLVFDADFSIAMSPSGSLLWSLEQVADARLTCRDEPLSVGSLAACGVYALRQKGQDPAAVDLRRLLPELELSEAMAVSGAKQRLHWLQDHRYCGRCGRPTQWHHADVALYCGECNHRYFPRLAPCVIVAIRDRDRMLLGRSHRHPPDLWSLIAGFIEPGESAEEAVHREVAEETGISLGNIRYMGSESWPFPHQLMLGYVADYQGGELVRAEDELADLAWFSVDELPRVPGPWTIAGRLIRSLAGAPERSL